MFLCVLCLQRAEEDKNTLELELCMVVNCLVVAGIEQPVRVLNTNPFLQTFCSFFPRTGFLCVTALAVLGLAL